METSRSSSTPTPSHPSIPRVSSLGFLPPLLGAIQCLALLLVTLVLWRMYLGGRISPWLLVPILLLSFIPYFIAVYMCAHRQASTTVRAIIVFAILFRLVLWVAPPTLSDDIYRYAWEGHVQHHRINPYALPPSAAGAEVLQTPKWQAVHERINHPTIPAIYPPFAQFAFRVLTWFPRPVGLMKLFFGAVDVLNVWLLVCILRERGMPQQYALIYAWNPLPVIEFAGSGHVLSFAIVLFLSAYLAMQRDRQIVAAVAAGLAFGTHFLIAAPLLHIFNALKKQWLPIVAIVLVLLYLPFLSAGKHLVEALTYYGAEWRFNDSLFGLLVRWFDDHSQPLLASDVYLAYRWPKLVVGIVLAVMALWFIFREKEWLRAGYLMTGTLLLLSPTVHPWYVTLILPFLCFYRNRGWLAFTALVMISYSAVAIRNLTGEWPALTLFPTGDRLEATWLGWIEYAPFFVLLVSDSFKREKLAV